MARNYIVVLDSDPKRKGWPWPLDYFPRGFHYAAEANDLVAHVEGKGGAAHVVPKAQFTPELLHQCGVMSHKDIDGFSKG